MLRWRDNDIMSYRMVERKKEDQPLVIEASGRMLSELSQRKIRRFGENIYEGDIFIQLGLNKQNLSKSRVREILDSFRVDENK